MRPAQRTLVAVAAAAVLGLACSGTSSVNGAGEARVTITLTDAPSDLFESAVVEIGEIQILPMDSTCEPMTRTCEPITLTTDGGTYDLLDLQNGVTADLASLVIEPGRYRQLRLIVESATVTLAEGLVFRDSTRTKNLIVPSGARTGIKVNLGWGRSNDGRAGVEIIPGETLIVVDFDVSQNFRIQGSPRSRWGIRGVIFRPLVRAVVQNVAGSIAGVVTDSATGDPIDGATVRATLTDPGTLEELETSDVTAITDSAGAYTLWYLAPGTYEVGVDSLSAPTQAVTLGDAADVTGIDFSGTF